MACHWTSLGLALLLSTFHGTVRAEIITRLPSSAKVVALTFDACETRTPSYLDRSIVDFLVTRRIPATIFVSGRFAERNRGDLERLSKMDFMEIENHSLNHRQHMELLSLEDLKKEVLGCERIIEEISGRKPRFFRFPAGNASREATHAVESLGYQVVHWSFPSGDPVRKTGPEKLACWVLGQTGPGSILIFHINGRGYSTGESLPRIVEELAKRGIGMVRLREVLGHEGPDSLASPGPPDEAGMEERRNDRPF
ncbi:MAG: polysaccharide deacetylase family protein [Syntrophobacteraceae bacterium]|jgi:peptidoglycan/xylan/chitin deacetylase (PgdA/CDA1 family)|nr:polysaccharide deacetylase family protein [Syntrophobacteraceae bacterium]